MLQIHKSKKDFGFEEYENDIIRFESYTDSYFTFVKVFHLMNITLTKVVERIYFDVKYLCQSFSLDEYNFDKDC